MRKVTAAYSAVVTHNNSLRSSQFRRHYYSLEPSARPPTMIEGDKIISSLQKLSTATALLPYDSLLLPSTTPLLRMSVARETSRPYENLKPVPHPARSLSDPTKLSVAYLSYDFRDHPMGHLTLGLVTGHDRSSFETTALSYGRNDSSHHRLSFESGVDAFLDAATSSSDRVDAIHAATILAQRSPHVAVDLMSHTRGGVLQIAAFKPAPIIVNYLGFPGTSGGEYFDYVVLDKHIASVEATEFKENIVVLPHTYQANDYDVKVPLCDGSRSTTCDLGHKLLGLGPDEIAVCNFNTFDKLEPTSFAVWMNMLLRVPRAKVGASEHHMSTYGTIVSKVINISSFATRFTRRSSSCFDRRTRSER